MYELVIAPAEYPGFKYRDRYVYEHHLVWWQKTGQVVPTGFIVHHKNEDKRDNRFENLQLMTPSEHTCEHNAGRTAYVELKCTMCGTWFQARQKLWEYKLRHGQTNFFCGRSCQVRHQHSRVV